MRDGSAPAIRVTGLGAGYGGRPVVHGVDLDVAPGEFVAILGASGCGKTTLLRTIAGFQPAMAGSIALFGTDVTGAPPERRNLAMVFQSYALWPHMTVLGNIGYGLKLRRVPKADIARRVEAVLGLLNLPGLADRKVTDLSGGQRQRVALGRALAIEPRILLLDEPLSNLDAKVRLQLRGEIKSLQRRLGFAAIHVTHDREEAMTMADRIVVMDQGRIAQAGPPEEVYDRPASAFIASFMGAENTIDLEVAPAGSGVEIRAAGAAPIQWSRPAPLGAVRAYFRDDAARIVAPDAASRDMIVLPARIASRAYPGGHYRYGLAVGDRHYSVKDTVYRETETAVGLGLPLEDLHLFPREEGPPGSTTERSDP
jgi:ABC-type Fe3+/spermidine/putrescine transport system ATPase subunit